MFVCVFFLHAAVGSGLLKKDEDMKTIKETGLAVPSKSLRSWDAAQENYRANLSDDFNQLLSLTFTQSNYCDFLSFYCGFSNCVCTLQMLCLLQ